MGKIKLFHKIEINNCHDKINLLKHVDLSILQKLFTIKLDVF